MSRKVGENCSRCRGTGWLLWQRKTWGWGWSPEAVIYIRAEAGHWHPLGYVIGFCPVCPCTVDEKLTPLDKSLQLQLQFHEERGLTADELCEESGYTAAQTRIRLAWLASYQGQGLRGATPLSGLNPYLPEIVYHVQPPGNLIVGEIKRLPAAQQVTPLRPPPAQRHGEAGAAHARRVAREERIDRRRYAREFMNSMRLVGATGRADSAPA